MKRTLITCCLFALLVLLWEGCAWWCPQLRFVLPAPSKVLMALWERGDVFAYQTMITLRVMMAGFVLALVVAFPLAWMMMLWASVSMVLQPVFVVIQCVPMFALAPLMVIWFGWSFTAIVIPTALMIFFPLTLNVYQGLRATPQALLDYFHVNQATSWQTFIKLRLPWAKTHIFAGFRISAAIAGIGAIAGEWAGAQEGLGVLMIESRRAADLETTFAALACLTAVSLTLYLITTLLERGVSRPRSAIKYAVAALLLLVVPMVSSCGQGQQQPVRLVLDWLPNPNHVPLYVGVEKGLFRQQGVDLVIEKIHDPGDSVPLVTSGQADIAVAYMPHTLRAVSRGAPLRVVGVLVDEPLNSLLCRGGEGIMDPSDLDGKVVGYSVSGLGTAFLDAMLSQRKITLKSKRNVVFDLITVLAAGQVDAVYGGYWNIEAAQLQALGVDTVVFKLSDFDIPDYSELILVTAAPSRIDRDAFGEALQEAIDFCRDHPDEAFDIYARANATKSRKTLEWEREAWKQTLPVLARQQRFDRTRWNTFAQWLDDHGMLSAPVDVDTIVCQLFPEINGCVHKHCFLRAEGS